MIHNNNNNNNNKIDSPQARAGRQLREACLSDCACGQPNWGVTGWFLESTCRSPGGAGRGCGGGGKLHDRPIPEIGLPPPPPDVVGCRRGGALHGATSLPVLVTNLVRGVPNFFLLLFYFIFKFLFFNLFLSFFCYIYIYIWFWFVF